MTRTGLLGGTFDPLHNGHYELAQAALRHGLDRLIVMPAGRPPHKADEVVSMAGYRFEMASQAFSGQTGVTVSDMEIMHPGPSYTLDTIDRLRQNLLPGDELILVYGSDVLATIEKWHKPADILAACPLLLAQRGGGSDLADQAKAEQLRRDYGARISFFAAPKIDLSSSQIRLAIQKGENCHTFLPEKVEKFISRNGLYRYQEELNALDVATWQRFYEIERLLWPLLSKKRLLHSLNVLVYALHLAVIHDVSPEKTGIAALLHDCAKCLPEQEIARYACETGERSLLDEALAHGPAGCRLAGEVFAIDDPSILRAILYHTTGCAGMGKLEQIIFIADKIEPARPYANLAAIRALAETDLDQAMLVCLKEIDVFLQRENLHSHPLTSEARADCSSRLADRKSTTREP
jgi:nicotinate-nucleotide adenylyltransferase